MRASMVIAGAGAALLLAFSQGTTQAAQSGQLTFEDRVRAQEAIERVYYSHQSGATLSFDAAVPEAALEAKVSAYLKQSVALERFWDTPVTADALAAELSRMVRESRARDRLNELFHALGNDAFLIQECLVRPVLVNRLTRNFFGSDETIHRLARTEAQTILDQLLSAQLGVEEEHPRQSIVVYSRRALSGRLTAEEDQAAETESKPDSSRRMEVSSEQFDQIRSRLPNGPGEIGALEQDSRSYQIRVLLAEEPDALRVARWTVPKLDWDQWWASVAGTLDELSAPTVASSSFDINETGPESVQAPPCVPDDTWITSSRFDDFQEPRVYHTAIWTGSLMIVWGGTSLGPASGTGARYDPATDTWTPVSTVNAPSPRALHTAVWTGELMLVWGGNSGGTGYLNTGGRYDPVMDKWTTMAQTILGARAGHTVVWTGTEMIVWGGQSLTTVALNSGARYDPHTDTWQLVSTLNAPDARHLHTAIWTGSEMVVWGGGNATGFMNTGGRYNPATDGWSLLPLTGAPSARVYHKAVWTGEVMVVWGGASVSDRPTSGGRYDPVTNTWAPTTATNAPAGRLSHVMVWTGNRVLIWGDGNGASYDPVQDRWSAIATVNQPPMTKLPSATWTGALMIVWGGWDVHLDDVRTGGRYNPTTNSWTPTAVLNFGPAARAEHTAIWTGSQMVVWGGRDGNYSLVRGGDRYDPALDIWLPVSTVNSPNYRVKHTSVWTGRYMVVWGAGNSPEPGGRYDPIRDVWLPISTLNAPPSGPHSAVWTGTRMIVWGGGTSSSGAGTGSIYDPDLDSWRPTSVLNAPYHRVEHTAVWTGSEMIIWGGASDLHAHRNDGGRYDPATDTWRSVSTLNAPSVRSDHTSIWTGQEMIIWGGRAHYGVSVPIYFGTGGRYNPITDTWIPTSLTNAPSARFLHTAVWTGRQLIIWGGQDCCVSTNEGARYDPVSDGWSPVSVIDAPRKRYSYTALWTGSFMAVWGGYPGPFNNGGLYALGLSEDDDGDQFSECDGDCDDANSTTFPGAPELCDGVNGDCSSLTWPATPWDELDLDRDDFRVCQNDCDDTNPSVRPSAAEQCNDIDDNCNGLVDEDPNGMDADGDGAGDMCDNCLLTANPGQEDQVHPNGVGDACDDPDADGVPDAADNCAEIPNAGQDDVDGDSVGTSCDICPALFNPAQQESVACIEVGPSKGQCLESRLSMDAAARRGKLTVHAERILTPTSMTFEINVSSCDRVDEFEFFLNGVLLGTFHDSSLACDCVPPIQSFAVTDAALLESLWNPGGNNTFRIRKSGALSPPGAYLGSFIAWVRVRLDSPKLTRTECLLDVDGGNCDQGLCAGGYTEDAVLQETVVANPLVVDEVLAQVSFSGGVLPDALDISQVPPGPARICIDAAGDGLLYGAGDYWKLFRIDPTTGAATPNGQLQVVFTTDIEYDNLAHRAHVAGGVPSPVIWEFDIQNGQTIGDPVSAGRYYHALEWIGTKLHAIYVPASGLSELRVLNPATGQSTVVGPTGRGAITGLAYDEDRGILYGSESTATNRNLLTLDVATGAAAVVGPLGVALVSLEFGPHGILYGGTGGGSFYRIDTSTGAASLVGPTGYASVEGLMLVAPWRSDCVSFQKGSEETLLINETCNTPPSAAAGADQAAECSSSSGAAITLDGTGSSDPDSTPGTRDGINQYEWFEGYGSASQTLLGTGDTLNVALSLGVHPITLKVTDTAGATATDDVAISVVDTTPPSLTVNLSPSTLWPPNHRMVDVTAGIIAEDVCGAPTVFLSAIASSEPEDMPGSGDGSTTDDVQGVEMGTADFSLALRAERDGAGRGRVYSVSYTAVDGSGNAVVAQMLASVPHDEGGVTEPLDLSVVETSAGTVVEWDDVPGALFYNVVRGELSSLRDVGDWIDLGDLTCVRTGSQNSDTVGFEDSHSPPPGASYFYLVEYNDGWESSFGEEGTAKPRIEGAGGCR